MKDIILAGIQASGKGTQAQKLLEKYGNQIAYFETGNILRALMSNENVIGNYLRETVNSGRLVKDEIIIGLFKVFLETLDEKHLLGDGNLRKKSIKGLPTAKCAKVVEKSILHCLMAKLKSASNAEGSSIFVQMMLIKMLSLIELLNIKKKLF